MMGSDNGLVQAVLLAHGVGKRCFPFGGDASPRPKYAFEAGGIPLVTHAARALLRAGVQELVVVTGFRSQALVQVVERDLPLDRVKTVEASCYDQGDLLPLRDGMAALKTGGPLLVMNADLFLAPGEIEGLVQAFMEGTKEQSLALVDPLHEEEDLLSWVTVEENGSGEAVRLIDHQEGPRLRLSGLYVLSQQEVSWLPSCEVKGGEGGYLFQAFSHGLGQGRRLGIHRALGRPIHVDRCFDYLDANQEICTRRVAAIKEENGVYRYVAGEGDPDPEYIFPGTLITPGATLVFEEGSFIGPYDSLEGHRLGIKNQGSAMIPIRIRGDVHLGKGSRIGLNALVEGGLVVGEDCSVEDSVIEPFVLLGNRVRVRRNAVIRGLTVCGNGSRYECAADFEGVGGNGTVYMHPGQCWIVTGEKCDLGAGNFVGTWRFDSGRSSYLIDNRSITPWIDRIANASYIGDDVRTGVGVCLAPGTRVGADTLLGPGFQAAGTLGPKRAYIPKQKDVVNCRVALVRKSRVP